MSTFREVGFSRRTARRSAATVLPTGLLAFAVAIPALAQEDGQMVFNNACRTCHSMDAGDNRLGPNLAGIVGRKAGAADGYAYSSAMKNSGITWDRDTLDRFIANPDQLVPGNNMKPYTGMTDEGQRKALLDFLAK